MVILPNCASSGVVTSVDPCVEIPFLDGAEGACTNTVSHDPYLVPHEEWMKIRPTMIMLRATHWTDIKKDWLRGCRMLIRDGQKCNVTVDSIDKAILQLEQIIKRTSK